MGFLGGLLGAGFGAADAAMQYGFQKKLQKSQFDFTERMSNTAYQRSMEDMRQANLNPMLVSKLGGASTPPGASASIAKTDLASSARSGMMMEQELRNLRRTEELIKGQTQANYEAAGHSDQKRRVEKVQEMILRNEIPAATAKGEFDKTKGGEVLRQIKRVKDAINPFNLRK